MPDVTVYCNPIHQQEHEHVMNVVADIFRNVFDNPNKPGSLRPEHITTHPGFTRKNQSFDCAFRIDVALKKSALSIQGEGRRESLTKQLAEEIKKALVDCNIMTSNEIIKVVTDTTEAVVARV